MIYKIYLKNIRIHRRNSKLGTRRNRSILRTLNQHSRNPSLRPTNTNPITRTTWTHTHPSIARTKTFPSRSLSGSPASRTAYTLFASSGLARAAPIALSHQTQELKINFTRETLFSASLVYNNTWCVGAKKQQRNKRKRDVGMLHTYIHILIPHRQMHTCWGSIISERLLFPNNPSLGSATHVEKFRGNSRNDPGDVNTVGCCLVVRMDLGSILFNYAVGVRAFFSLARAGEGTKNSF